jgi:hypothetical protein
MDYILRANNPSKILAGSKVYLTESGSWSGLKREAKVFTAKTKATEAKKASTIACELINPDFETNQPVEDAL